MWRFRANSFLSPWSVRSVQTEQTVDAFLSETCSWSPCRGSSNTTCCYKYVYPTVCGALEPCVFDWFCNVFLQELVKHTTDLTDKENLRIALDAMRVSVCLCVRYRLVHSSWSVLCFQDLAQCVNEVKRDNEIIKQITTFQLSIENLVRDSRFIKPFTWACVCFFCPLLIYTLLFALDPFSCSLRSAKDWRRA